MGILSALTRRRLLEGAGALSLVPATARSAASAAHTSAPREEHVLDLLAFADPLGAEWRPITGGTFKGPRLAGEVLPGGTLRITARQDGVSVVETSCSLRTDAGEVVALTARALLDADVSATRPVHAVPEFDAFPGASDWLNRAVLVAALDPVRLREGRLSIRIHRLA